MLETRLCDFEHLLDFDINRLLPEWVRGILPPFFENNIPDSGSTSHVFLASSSVD